ncbi:MAG: hypothetical protein MRECE_1c115 [Mycoplasmataceae bacterium CE_OT135]|nr:MAG: hypothetical protein MRECE_1c052 [Mycoplasmataceae bacterium CE_OT135]KLL04350.1 MAG: hypothetical protein MRECE_1c115 [Mycoplasmataceae bacterium CE_OT135]
MEYSKLLFEGQRKHNLFSSFPFKLFTLKTSKKLC